MAAYQIESGVCHGRGFAGADPTGFLAKFYTWITKAPGSGGPGWFIIDDQSALGTDPYIVVSDVEVPIVNDYNTGQSGGAPKFIKIGLVSASSGSVRVQYMMWWDVGSHVWRGLFGGIYIATGDDVDFAYDFRGGEECMIIQSRIGTDWDSAIIDDFIGDSNLLEGADKVGTLQGGVTAGDDVVLQLDTGEAANFTQDYNYYIYDFDGHTWIDYIKITNVNTGADQITVDTLRQNFPSGSVIGAYCHRHYVLGNWIVFSATNMSSRKSTIPYVSNPDYVSWISGSVYQTVVPTRESAYLSRMSPNDKGVNAVQRPGIQELVSATNEYPQRDEGMNRGYGITKNVYITLKGLMARGQDGKIVNSKNYLYFQLESDVFSDGSGSFAALFLDTESLS